MKFTYTENFKIKSMYYKKTHYWGIGYLNEILKEIKTKFGREEFPDREDIPCSVTHAER